MDPVTTHDIRTASPESTHLLVSVESQVGFIPNDIAVLAESTPALEVIVGDSVKTMSNLANNAFGIPVPDAFSGCVWTPFSNRGEIRNNVA